MTSPVSEGMAAFLKDEVAGMHPVYHSQESCRTYLGNLEQGLGNVNNAGHQLDIADAGLDGGGVVGTGLVEDVLDLVVLGLGPLGVHGTAILDEGAPDGEQGDGDDGLLVDDVVLVADGVSAQGGGGREDGRLGDEGVARKGIDERLRLLLGLLGGHVGDVAGGNGRDGGQGAPGDGRPEEVRSC